MVPRYDRFVDETGPESDRLRRWLEWPDDEIGAAAAAMSEELGAATYCRVHKDGRVTGGLKYHEGRMAALAEARRLARGPGNVKVALSPFGRAGWSSQRRRAAEPASPPWVSYATGGFEAADQTLEAFTRMGE